MSCPTTNWSRWATRDFGEGIEASLASREGRTGGGAGSGTGWGVISERARVAQTPQMRLVESKPPSKRGMSLVKQKSQQGAWSDMGTPEVEAFQDHPHWVVGLLTRGCQMPQGRPSDR